MSAPNNDGENMSANETTTTTDNSEELRAGIGRVEAGRLAEIECLGGYGAAIQGVAPNGAVLVGVLAPAATRDQRPHLVTADGRHYALATYEPQSDDLPPVSADEALALGTARELDLIARGSTEERNEALTAIAKRKSTGANAPRR